MKTRIVHTKVWRDEWFVNLSQEAKFLWLYLITNDKINISGIYEITDREIKFDTGIEITESIKEELKPKALFFKNWVFIPNVDKYNKYRNAPTNQKAFETEMSNIPDDIIEHILSDTSMYTSIYTHPILQEIINNKSEIRNKEQEILNKESKLGEKTDLPFDWGGEKVSLEEARKRLSDKLNWKN